MQPHSHTPAAGCLEGRARRPHHTARLPCHCTPLLASCSCSAPHDAVQTFHHARLCLLYGLPLWLWLFLTASSGIDLHSNMIAAHILMYTHMLGTICSNAWRRLQKCYCDLRYEINSYYLCFCIGMSKKPYLASVLDCEHHGLIHNARCACCLAFYHAT